MAPMIRGRSRENMCSRTRAASGRYAVRIRTDVTLLIALACLVAGFILDPDKDTIGIILFVATCAFFILAIAQFIRERRKPSR